MDEVVRWIGVGTMKVVPLSESYNDAYDDFLNRTDAALLYHTRKYKALLEHLLGCESHYWLAVKEGKVEGVLPLMATRGPYGEVINSLPFYGSIGGVLAGSRLALETLCRKYEDVIRDVGVAASTMVTNPFDHSYSGLISYDFVDKRIGQVTDLPGGSGDTVSDEIFRSIDGSARRNIKKAARCGIDVSVENNAVNFLHRVHVDNMKTIGGKSKPVIFFELLKKIFVADEDYRIYVARTVGDREPVAALLVFYFKETVEYFIPATVHSYRERQPMAAILWRAMCDAGTMGYRWWNWGGTWESQKGVYRFKKKWGARDIMYQYYIKLNNMRILKDSPGGLERYYKYFYVVPFSALCE